MFHVLLYERFPSPPPPPLNLDAKRSISREGNECWLKNFSTTILNLTNAALPPPCILRPSLEFLACRRKKVTPAEILKSHSWQVLRVRREPRDGVSRMPPSPFTLFLEFPNLKLLREREREKRHPSSSYSRSHTSTNTWKSRHGH